MAVFVAEKILNHRINTETGDAQFQIEKEGEMLWISSKDLAGFSKMLREYFVDHKIDAVSFFSTAAAQKRHIRRSQIGKQKRKDKVNSNSSSSASKGDCMQEHTHSNEIYIVELEKVNSQGKKMRKVCTRQPDQTFVSLKDRSIQRHSLKQKKVFQSSIIKRERRAFLAAKQNIKKHIKIEGDTSKLNFVSVPRDWQSNADSADSASQYLHHTTHSIITMNELYSPTIPSGSIEVSISPPATPNREVKLTTQTPSSFRTGPHSLQPEKQEGDPSDELGKQSGRKLSFRPRMKLSRQICVSTESCNSNILSLTTNHLSTYLISTRPVHYKTVASSNALYQATLDAWEYYLNKTCHGIEAYIYVENTVDTIPPPLDFTYITDRRLIPEIIKPLPRTRDFVCCCIEGGECTTCVCASGFGSTPCYSEKGKVIVSAATPLVECCSSCGCGPTCHRRVLQKRRQIPVCIFKTQAKGWGIKSVVFIEKGSFIVEFVGEIITDEMAEHQGRISNSKGLTYLFDLDIDTDSSHKPYSIDSTRYGNISRFCNHSCSPNMTIYNAWIESMDPRFPHVGFFAARDIFPGEELTFDYKIDFINGQEPCFCDSEQCRGFLW